jgi:hypothetical protein
MFLCAIANSSVFDSLVAAQLARVELAQSFEVGLISTTPIPNNLDPRLGELALAAWTAKRRTDTANATSHAFLRPALAQPGSTLAKGIESWSSLLGESAAVFDAVQSEIDDIAYRLYGLGEEDRRAIEKTLGGPEGGSQDSTDDSVEDEEADESASIGANGPDLVTDLLDYLFGCSFGRWDIRYATEKKNIPEPPAPFDPLPACPTAQLQNALGLPARPEDVDAGYPIEIPWDGILVDDENHPHDVIKRVREILGIVWEDRAEAIEQEACEILEVRSLRDWFRNSNNFFAAHLRRHSKSRRQAPIYWPLSSPNGLYTVWLYYHRLTADTLFTVLRDYLKPKLEFTEHRAFQLRQEAGTTLSPSQRRNIAEAEELVGDLNALKADLERVAPLFRPNLNDGVVINYAPLWRMIGLPKWRRDCQTIWNKLAKGDYDWAHLAMHLWPERVVPKCATDRSLAIAHGLDEVFWEEDSQKPGRWIARKVTDLELRGLMAERTSAAVKASVDSLVGTTNNEGVPSRRRRGTTA